MPSSSIYYDRLREIKPTSEEEILGAGFAFPLQVTESGGAKITVGEENVKSAIFHIAAYRRGDLYGCASFGGNVPNMIFTVFSGDKLKMHEEWLKQGIENWEPRIKDLRVTAGKDVDETKETKVVILVQYQVKATDTESFTLLPVEKG
jgi:phage baseplate assembly protein W